MHSIIYEAWATLLHSTRDMERLLDNIDLLIDFRWVSKMIKKKFKSTVLCCAFHPTNAQLLATGCADFKCRVFSTFSTDVDGNEVNAGPFGSPLEFGEAYTEISALGWINAVAWSPSGSVLAFAGKLFIPSYIFC